MNLNLLIPFNQKNIEFLKKKEINLEKPNLELTTLTSNILQKIFENNFNFPNVDEKYLTEYYAFYPIARIILSNVNKEKFYNEFSDFYFKTLKKELKEPDDALKLLNINFKKEKDYYLISFEYYLRAKTYSEKDKLVNKNLMNGFVFLNKEQTNNFVARFVAAKVIENLPLNVNFSKDIKIIAKNIENKFKPKVKYENYNLGTIKTENFPPCMQNILNRILKQENPSHIERYYLATYLYNIKMDFEEILNIFKNTKDYNEKIASYQLEKLKKYSCPNCETIKTVGLCYKEEFCEKINHPVKYYLKKSFISKMQKDTNNERDNQQIQ